MGGGGDELQVRQLTAGDTDHRRALHLAIGIAPPPAGTVAPEAADVLATAARHSRPLDLVFGAYVDGRLEGAALGLESPGAAAVVYGSWHPRTRSSNRATIAALARLREAAWERPLKLLEVLAEPDCPRAASILRAAGFRHLTELLYLQRRTYGAETSTPAAPRLTWIGYAPELAPLFCEALEATYAQSLDCPELSGLRTTPEVLAGHQATGIFDASLWWLAKRAGTPVGILLLNRLAAQPTLEIVYLGVAQRARGTGVGDALLTRAVTGARRSGAKLLTLGVDARNTPARRMYERWGFAPRAVRSAWIASSSPE